MSAAVPDLDVDGMVGLLAAGADVPLSPAIPVSQLEHALQTAAMLAHLHPGDDELAAAGLVHDIGHLLPGGTDETHATDAARRGAAGAGGTGGRDGGTPRGGEAVSRGDGGRLRRGADDRQRALAGTPGGRA